MDISGTGDAIVLKISYQDCERSALQVLRAATGERLWSAPDFGDDGLMVSATVGGDLMLLAYPNVLVARDALTGEERWRAEVMLRPVVPMAADNDLVVLAPYTTGASFTRITAMSTITGATQWSVDVGVPVLQLTLSGDSVVAQVSVTPDAGTGGSNQPVPWLWGFDAPSGNRIWATALHQAERLPALRASDGIVIASLDRSSYLAPDPSTGEPRELGPLSAVVAVSGGSGERRWAVERRVPSLDGGVSVLDAGSGVVLGTDGGAVVAWDAATGEERWRTSAAASHGSVAGDVAVLPRAVSDGESGQVIVALDLVAGSERWRIDGRSAGERLAGTAQTESDGVVSWRPGMQ